MQWISVKDRLPKRDVNMSEFARLNVLAFDGQVVEQVYFNDNIFNDLDCGNIESWCQRHSNIDIKNITHWMPMPNQPERLSEKTS